MKQKLFIVYIGIFLLLPHIANTKSRIYYSTFETIRFLDYRGSEVKVRMVYTNEHSVYCISNKQIIYEYSISDRKLTRYLIPTLQMDRVTAFAAITPKLFLLTDKRSIYRIQLPSLYPHILKKVRLEAPVVQIIPLSLTLVLLVEQTNILLLDIEKQQGQVIYRLPAGSGKIKKAVIGSDARIYAITEKALIVINFRPYSPEKRIKHITGLKDIYSDAYNSLLLLNKQYLIISSTSNNNDKIPVQSGKYISTTGPGRIWLYDERQVYRLIDKKWHALPIDNYNFLSPILFFTEGNPGELILVSPKYITILHDINSAKEQVRATLSILETYCLPYHAWPIFTKEVQQLLGFLSQLDDTNLKLKILTILVEGIIYLPQWEQRIVAAVLQLPESPGRKRLIHRLINQLSGKSWRYAVFLEEERQKSQVGIESQVRTQLNIAQLMAVDTTNFSVIGYRLQQFMRNYENLIFSPGLRDSILFFSLKYSPRFLRKIDPQEVTYWQKLAKSSKNPLIQSYADQYFFVDRTRKFFSIDTNRLADIVPLQLPRGVQFFTMRNGKLWFVKNNFLYLTQQDSREIRHRVKIKKLIPFHQSILGLSNNGKLYVLKEDKPILFQPEPPVPFQNIWEGGSTIVALSHQRKTAIWLFDTHAGKWEGPFSVPSQVKQTFFLYIQRVNETEFMLVGHQKVYRYIINTQQVLNLALPPEILYIYDCVKDNRGGFYFATDKGLWYRTVSGEWQNITQKDGLYPQPVFRLAYHHRKGALGIVGPQQLAIGDQFGWLTLPTSMVSSVSPSVQIALDDSLNFALYHDDKGYIWKRNYLDKSNLINRLLVLWETPTWTGKLRLLLPLIQRAGRISGLYAWSTAFQIYIFLQKGEYQKVLDLLEIALGKPLATNPWISEFHGLLVVDLLFRQQKWQEGVKALERLYPLIKTKAIRQFVITYLFERLNQYGVAYFPKKKLDLILWLKHQHLNADEHKQLDKIASGCLSYLWIQNDPHFSRIARLFIKDESTRPINTYWKYLLFKQTIHNGKANDVREFYLKQFPDDHQLKSPYTFWGGEAFLKNTLQLIIR